MRWFCYVRLNISILMLSVKVRMKRQFRHNVLRPWQKIVLVIYNSSSDLLQTIFSSSLYGIKRVLRKVKATCLYLLVILILCSFRHWFSLFFDYVYWWSEFKWIYGPFFLTAVYKSSIDKHLLSACYQLLHGIKLCPPHNVLCQSDCQI